MSGMTSCLSAVCPFPSAFAQVMMHFPISWDEGTSSQVFASINNQLIQTQDRKKKKKRTEEIIFDNALYHEWISPALSLNLHLKQSSIQMINRIILQFVSLQSVNKMQTFTGEFITFKGVRKLIISASDAIDDVRDIQTNSPLKKITKFATALEPAE